jgi:hypothetical protein
MDSFIVLARSQGDQIGRIFAHWVIFFFGQFFENYRSSPNIWATLFNGKSCLIILTKTDLVFIFGQLFHQLIWSP